MSSTPKTPRSRGGARRPDGRGSRGPGGTLARASAAAPAASPWLDRAAWALVAAFGAVLLAIVLGPHRVGDVFTETDFYGSYGLGARALQAGHLNPSRYGVVGPVHEISLALVGFVVRDLFLAAELLSAASALVALLLWHRIARARAGALPALLAVAFLAANAQFLRYGYAATTDALALAVQAGALALLLTGEPTARRVFAAGALAGLAFLTRYNAVALLPAGALALVLGWAGAPGGRRLRGALLFAAGWLAPVLPWIAVSLASGAHFAFQLHHNLAFDVFARAKGIPWDTYQRELEPQFPTPWSVFARDPGAVLARIASNVGSHLLLDARRLVGVPVALAALAGLAFAWFDGTLARLRAVLLAGALLFLALVPAFHNERWSLATLPVWALLAATAFGSPKLALAIGVGGAPGAAGPRRLWLKSLLAAVPLLLSVRASVAVQLRVFDQLPVEVLEVARTVKPLLRPGERVMARKPHFAWHAGLSPVAFPYVDSLSQLAKVAREGRVRWLYFSWPEAEMRPDFSYLLDTSAVVPGLTPRAVTTHWPAVLYEIGPEFGRDPDWLANDYVRAVHRARAQVSISNVDWRARMVVAQAERERGRFEEAQKLLDEAAALAPNQPDVLLALGDNLLRTDRPAEAAATFDRLESLAPGDPRTRLGRGWAAAMQRQDADAAALWRPVVPYAGDAATLGRMHQLFSAAGDAATVAAVEARMREIGLRP
jgi:tetratricopeptide (TPR) repeat protein